MRLSIFGLVLLADLCLSQTNTTGFLKTRGRDFELDGQKFAFVGTNSYWLGLLDSPDDVTATFQGMKNAGVKVVRTWGHNAINASELANATASGLTYYQLWNSSDWQLNDGPNGLQRLDNVVVTAEKFNIKLIVTMTNNWVGYGGSELYVAWIKGANATHDVFFTDPQISDSFQRYVTVIVNRYKNSSAIGAWELINEARCLGDRPGGPNCVPGTELLNIWYRKQSDFIRGLDPHHLISAGGEGHFYWAVPPNITFNGTTSTDYNFNGQAGEDFELDLRLPNIDFGVYHLYPQSWYPQLDHPGFDFSIEQWGLDWMQAHVSTGDMVGKPTVIEEFGVTGLENQTRIYKTWVQYALDTHHAGIMPWQFGQLGLTENGGNRLIKYADAIIDGASPNDGYAIYPNETSLFEIFTNAANVQNERSG